MHDLAPIEYKSEILPPLPPSQAPALADAAMDHPDDLPEDLIFTPVPRLTKRWNGINADKQRIFIRHLAETGSVTMAAKVINTSPSAMYGLRRGAGAESFAEAWEKAVQAGARRVLDVLIEHAVHGTPEKLLKDGEVILERRKYNTRAMMWIVSHQFPEQYGSATGLMNLSGMSGPMKRLKEKWRAEWDAEQAEQARTEAQEEEADRPNRVYDIVLRLGEVYKRKLFEERHFRVNGDPVGADFALRQLTCIELLIEFGGQIHDFTDAFLSDEDWCRIASTRHTRSLDEARREAWARVEEPARPPLYWYEQAPTAQNCYLPKDDPRNQWTSEDWQKAPGQRPGYSLTGGENVSVRARMLDDARNHFAQGQWLWETATDPVRFEAWRATWKGEKPERWEA